MCYHATINATVPNIRKKYAGINTEEIEKINPNFHLNGFNHPNIPILTNNNRDKFQLFEWGLIPTWSKDLDQAMQKRNFTLNARIETIDTKPSFKDCIHQRCIIPFSGFFEFFELAGKKLPFYFHFKDNELFSVAGLFSEWKNPENQKILSSFTLITLANNVEMQIRNYPTICDRFPMVLNNELEQKWLNDESLNTCQNSSKTFINNEMQYHEVSRNLTKKNIDTNHISTILPFLETKKPTLFD